MHQVAASESIKEINLLQLFPTLCSYWRFQFPKKKNLSGQIQIGKEERKFVINVRDHIEWGKMNILRNVILIGKEGHKDWIGKKKTNKIPLEGSFW